MPFPWKKVRSTRISQLVNDHLNISQKRRDGSSLVVETGFPTSLIDLFIKNREKLKKPSKKKRHSQPITSPNDAAVIEGSPLSCPSPLPPPPPPPPPSLAGSPSPPLRQSTVLPPPSSCANEICVVGSSDGAATLDGADAEERGGESGGDMNEVLIGVLKIFVVVVLALSTKRLTVGITISAVLLLLLEYVGKHCRRLSKPCATAKAAAMPVVQIGGRLLSYKKLEKKQEPLTKPVSSRFPVQEIQVLDSTVEEIQPENEMTEASLSRERLGYQEIELVEMAMKREESISNLADCKRKSRKAKIGSKMKKIVPKKFRAPKKEHDLPIILCEEQVYHSDNIEESENGSISSSVSDYSEEDGKSSTVCFDRRLSDVIEEAEETKIGCKIEAAVARRYMLLGLIVLAGLIGGRLFALVLTLSWFLLLKLGQALPRSIDLPMIMSLNVKSG